jgi:nucleoid DNA-binding protein
MALFKKKTVVEEEVEEMEEEVVVPKKKVKAPVVVEEEEEEEEEVAPPPKKKKVIAPVEEEEEEEEVVPPPKKKAKAVVVEEDDEPAPVVKKKAVVAPPVKKKAVVEAPAKKKTSFGGKATTAKKAPSASTSGIMKDIEDFLFDKAAENDAPITRTDANAVVKTVFEAIREVTKAKGRLQISELMVVQTKTRPAYVGRNPQNGKAVKVPASTIISIKPSKLFKEFIRE